MLGKKKLTIAGLPKINPLQLPKKMLQLVDAVNHAPTMPSYYPEQNENK